ncbi:MAG: PLP-dependent aspartate aminotransferase family protein [Clostridiaceae bacterium]
MGENTSINTKIVRGNKSYDEVTGSISMPIYQSATFRHPALGQSTGYDYSRLQNPTREELEKTIALLENGNHGFAFASGMASISTLLKVFKPGDHIIISEDLYGGTYRLFKEIYNVYNIESSFVDTAKLDEVKAALKDNTAGIFIETPSNPMMRVSDIKAISEIAKERGILTIVDNTFLTPYLQRPLELGADVVIHSGTKYLCGHNDTLSGFLICNDDELAEKVGFIQMSEGAMLSPFDSWLMIRGIKTLAVRIDKQEENAMKIANWLREQEIVEKVYYVGLSDHEGYEISKKQSSGFGSMISFTVKSAELAEQIINKVDLIYFAESLGGVETLITYPWVQTHAAIPEDIRNRIGVDVKLLRLSVGIEGVDDLINDLKQAMGC